MEVALKEARNALARGEVPVGCAIFNREGRLLATGSNRTNERGDGTAHAEFMALEQLKKDGLSAVELENLTLYVTCEPCIMCAAALVQSGRFEHIEYGCANPRFGGCGSVRNLGIHFENVFGTDIKHDGESGHVSTRTYNRPIIKAGTDASECIKLLNMFYSQANPNAPRPKKRRKLIMKGADD